MNQEQYYYNHLLTECRCYCCRGWRYRLGINNNNNRELNMDGGYIYETPNTNHSRIKVSRSNNDNNNKKKNNNDSNNNDKKKKKSKARRIGSFKNHIEYGTDEWKHFAFVLNDSSNDLERWRNYSGVVSRDTIINSDKSDNSDIDNLSSLDILGMDLIPSDNETSFSDIILNESFPCQKTKMDDNNIEQTYQNNIFTSDYDLEVVKITSKESNNRIVVLNSDYTTSKSIHDVNEYVQKNKKAKRDETSNTKSEVPAPVPATTTASSATTTTTTGPLTIIANHVQIGPMTKILFTEAFSPLILSNDDKDDKDDNDNHNDDMVPLSRSSSRSHSSVSFTDIVESNDFPMSKHLTFDANTTKFDNKTDKRNKFIITPSSKKADNYTV